METDDTLARLTFNAMATRAFFTDRTNGVRLRIESGVVAFRPVTARRGIDVLTLVRRPRGYIADVARDALTRRLMRRLFKAGLSEAQPYFKLEPTTPRGWFVLDHHPADLPPQRQPLMVVSDFDPPPVAIDMGLWRRLQRAMNGPPPIALALWQDFMAMFHSAVRMTERTTRGPKSNDRVQAERLLTIIERNVVAFQTLAMEQPEVADDVASLLFSVTGESVGDNDNSVITLPSQRIAPPTRTKPEVSRQYVEQVLTGKSGRRPRQKWPEASEEDIRAAARLMESESDPDEAAIEAVVHRVEPEAPERETQARKPKRRPRRKWPEATEADLRTNMELMESVLDPNSDQSVAETPEIDHNLATDPTASTDPVEESVEGSADMESEVEEVEVEEIVVEELTGDIDAEPESEEVAEETAEVADETIVIDTIDAPETQPVSEPITDPLDTPVIPLDTLTTIEAPLAAEAFEPEADPDPLADPEPATAVTETQAETPETASHEGEFDLPDVMPPRSTPDRDEEEVIDDEHDETKK